MREFLDSCINRVADSFKIDMHKDIWREYIRLLDAGYEVTQNNLSQRFNISQAQLSRILMKGKKRLKYYLEEGN